LIGVYSDVLYVVESRHPRDTRMVKTFKQLAGSFEEYDGEVEGML
jgi:hypothetical protein